MLYIIGYNDTDKLFKLYNSDCDSSKLITQNEVNELINNCASVPDEQQRLKREVRHLKRLLSRQVDNPVVEHHIMYYSCDYDESSYTISNIRAHLFNGAVVPILDLYSMGLNKAEREQLYSFVCSDHFTLDSHNYFLMNSGNYFIQGMKQSVTGDTHVFSLLVNGTGRVLPVVFISYGGVYLCVLALPGAEYKTHSSTCTVYPILNEGIGYHIMHLKDDINRIHYSGAEIWTDYLLASRTLYSSDSFDPRPVRDYDYKLKAFDSYGYLIENGLVKPGLVQLFNSAIDYSHIAKLRDTMRDMQESLGMYGNDTVLKVVVDGVLEAVLPIDSDSIVLDIAGIKVIRGNVLSVYSHITLVCNGDFVLEEYQPERDALNSVHQSFHYLDKELKNKVNQIKAISSIAFKFV